MTKDARIILIDDSVVVRGLLAKIIEAENGLTVVGTASDGLIGSRKVETLQPDLVVLDIEMPNMDGLQTLQKIRAAGNRVPIIMFSTLTAHGATSALKALELGATDYATKPVHTTTFAESMVHVQADLIAKIRALTARPERRNREPAPVSRPGRSGERRVRPRGTPIDAVTIGCSTGGPVALQTVVTSWHKPLPVPVFVVQHMPATFTKTLAERIDRAAATTVVEAEPGMIAEPGVCYIAPGSHHLILKRRGDSVVTALDDGPLENSCRPSVEPLFRSAITAYQDRLAAVILTGMGHDGVVAAGEVARLGSPVIAQDQATSVVWGMPRAVVEEGDATDVLPVEEIGPRIAKLVEHAALVMTGRRATGVT